MKNLYLYIYILFAPFFCLKAEPIESRQIKNHQIRQQLINQQKIKNYLRIESLAYNVILYFPPPKKRFAMENIDELIKEYRLYEKMRDAWCSANGRGGAVYKLIDNKYKIGQYQQQLVTLYENTCPLFTVKSK